KLDLPKLHDLLENVAKRGNELREIEIECELRGSARIFAVNARSIHRDGDPGLILLALEDITERKQEAEARYRRLFEASKDGILVADARTGRITDVNPFFEELTGYPRGEIVGKALPDLEA